MGTSDQIQLIMYGASVIFGAGLLVGELRNRWKNKKKNDNGSIKIPIYDGNGKRIDNLEDESSESVQRITRVETKVTAIESEVLLTRNSIHELHGKMNQYFLENDVHKALADFQLEFLARLNGTYVRADLLREQERRADETHRSLQHQIDELKRKTRG